MAQPLTLRKASKIELVSLIDNSVDLLSTPSRREVETLWHWCGRTGEMPVAEHGFSMLIRVFGVDGVHTVLFDTGVSPNGVVENAKRMGLNLGNVEVVVLSHGHYDHFGGLTKVVEAINRESLEIIAHKDMFRRRGTLNFKGEIREYPTFPQIPQSKPLKIVNTTQPFPICGGYGVVSGEIPRTVEFEKGLLNNQIFRDGAWQPDPDLMDERALVFDVEGKGLVVVSGCAHAGIINTLRYAQEITGESEVYGVFGGFHLAGREFEKRIEVTVEELRKFSPKMVASSHCTGWRALYALHVAFPDVFVFNSVGNRYNL